ncbi:MAG: tyrosine-type recombinase/integrase [Acidobacteriota bacterium]
MGRPSRVRVIGPLELYASGFRRELVRQGYTAHSASNQLQLMAHASRWLASHGLDAGDLIPARVEEFLGTRRAEGYRLWLSTKAMAPLLAYLRGLGVVPTPGPVVPATSAEGLLERYRGYLIRERGLAASTIAAYSHVARLFLFHRSPEGELGLEHLSAAEVTDFVAAECRTRKIGSAKYIVCGLRALLRFLYAEGHVKSALAAAVPSVAGWRLAGLPRALSRREVSALLASCDRRTTTGRRDFAVLTLLARLALRAGEAAALALVDFDWRAGEVVIRGKGRREERLPLPTDVGEALVGWLRRGRPRCQSPKLFTRVRAPHRGMTNSAVSGVVRTAAARAGLSGVSAHRLRHTAATEMLRAGAGLLEIGHVLRHASTLTTSLYAKVDRQSLRALAQPWPGGEA